MAKTKKELNRLLSAQQTLFDSELSEGALDVSMVFRDALSKVLRGCKDSRWQISARISELSLHNISKDMLDKFTSSNQDYGLRAEDLTAFCAATKSIEPIRVLIEPLGYELISPDESDYVRLARLEKQRTKLEAEIVELRRRAGIGIK